LDRFEAGLIAKMENRNAKKERHRHGHGHEYSIEKLSSSQVSSHGGQGGEHEDDVRHKKKKKYPDSTQGMSSQDVDGMSVDLDAPQRYIPTPTPEKKRKSENIEFQRERRSSVSRDRSLFEEVNETIDVETLDLQLGKKKAQEDNPRLSAEEKAKRKKEKKRRLKEMKAEEVKKKQADKEIKAVMKALEESKTMGMDEGEQDAAIREESVVETPKKKRKLNKEVSQENPEISKVEDEQGSGNANAQETPKSMPKMKKRKIGDSAQSTSIQLDSIPIHDAKSYLTSTVEPSPQVEVEDNAAETTSKHKKKRKPFQESPLNRHTLPKHEPSSTPGRTNFDLDSNGVDGNSERKKKKKKKAKVSKESVGMTCLVPSSLLTGAAKAEGALLQTVLKGCLSNGSNSNLASGEASKTSSINAVSSSEVENEELPRGGIPIRLPKSKVNVPSSPPPIRPKNETGNETPILPPKRLVQTATPSRIILPKLARPKKVMAVPMTDSDEDEEKREAKKPTVSGSKKSKAVKREAETEQTFSQTITSIKKATDSKIHELFSDDESEEEKDEDPFTQALDSIRRSSSKLQNLFSLVPDSSCTPSMNMKSKKHGSSVKAERARSASINTVLPLVFNEGGINMAGEDWETTVGKLRSIVVGDDDSEVQESTSLPDPLYHFQLLTIIEQI
jgi:hypothetical protein